MLEKQIIHSFVSIVGEDNVDTSNMGRLTYSYDATPNFQAMPDAVIAPRNTNEVAEVLKVCNTHKIPVYVRGLEQIFAQEHVHLKAVSSLFSAI